MPELTICENRLLDKSQREVLLRGINFAAEAKFPLDGGDSFVGSPCSLNEADAHYTRLRRLGFNTLRFIYTWEALEHSGPGQYDEAYIDYAIAMVQKAVEHGFYVFMDPHQDVWSRFSGGSGAPLWTLEAAGFDCSKFEDTHAAFLYHEEDPKPVKMLWSSNYFRLVSATMFTVFFGGQKFAPKCTINDVDVGTYLHQHYLDAIKHFMTRFNDAKVPVLGWESLNEPGHGYIGTNDLGELSSSPTCVKLTTAPTPFQSMALGYGTPQLVDFYRFTSMGIRKDPPVQVNPKSGVWLDKEQLEKIDSKYGWRRNWYGCIWKHHGVHDGTSLLKPNYFKEKFTLDENIFIEKYFMAHWDVFYKMTREINPEWFVFMQAPVNHPPPNCIGQGREICPKDKVIFTPHYYDGLTLMLKRWMWMNVDAVGVCRNMYANPVLAVKIGPRAIRNGFAQQLAYVKREGIDRVGNIPCLVSEIGIPYDMDNKRAYTNGMFHDQIQAMDSNHFGLESSKLSHTLWVYACANTNKYGDRWCGEDLSIWSQDNGDPSIDANDPEEYNNGIRAAAAVIRPTPIAVNGSLVSFNFDIYRAAFEMEIEGSDTEKAPTTIYVPSYYFGKDPSSLWVSSGSIEIKDQILYWTHEAGRHNIRIKGVTHFSDTMYYYADHIVKTFHIAKREISGLFRRRSVT